MLNYESYREQYEKQHPASVPVPPAVVRSEYPRWLRGVVLLMFVCAALLSGVHTVPTVYAGIEGGGVVAPLVRALVSLSSFVAVELAIFVAAYARLKANGWLVGAMLVVTFSIALVSNIQSVLKALGANGELGVTVVGVVLGIGAPLIALMSGEMFVHMHSASTKADSEAEARYREERKAFDAVVLTSYRKYEKDMSAKALSERTDNRTDTGLLSAGFVRSDTDTDGHGQPSRAAFGHTRTTDGLQKALDWFDANPDKVNGSLRDLEPLVGVGRDTLSRARRQWLQMRAGQPTVSTNGNGANDG